MTIVLGIVVILLTVKAVLSHVDVRLALITAAFGLSLAAGIGDSAAIVGRGKATPSEVRDALTAPTVCVVRAFLTSAGDEKFIIPICMAMGFASVLRVTQCNEHLVGLLISPFRRMRVMFVPGVILAGILINLTLVSQAASAAAAATVLIPLGRALQLPSAVIGAALLLGCSIGGELLNPGSPEVRSVVEGSRHIVPQVQASDVIRKTRGLFIVHVLCAGAVFVITNWSQCRENVTISREVERISITKALIPFVPLILLTVVTPPFQLWRVPPNWLLVNPNNATEARMFDSRLVGAAMLIGVLLAGLRCPTLAQAVTKAFCDGAGLAYTSIITIIVAATCFGEGIKVAGLTAILGSATDSWPILLQPLAAVLAGMFGYLSGSGMAATQTLFPFFADGAADAGVDPLETGSIVSLGSGAGRTMSPVSAVNIVCSSVANSTPIELSKRVAPGLLFGMMVVVLIVTMT